MNLMVISILEIIYQLRKDVNTRRGNLQMPQKLLHGDMATSKTILYDVSVHG